MKMSDTQAFWYSLHQGMDMYISGIISTICDLIIFFFFKKENDFSKFALKKF